jgi:hypothetical protein
MSPIKSKDVQLFFCTTLTVSDHGGGNTVTTVIVVKDRRTTTGQVCFTPRCKILKQPRRKNHMGAFFGWFYFMVLCHQLQAKMLFSSTSSSSFFVTSRRYDPWQSEYTRNLLLHIPFVFLVMIRDEGSSQGMWNVKFGMWGSTLWKTCPPHHATLLWRGELALSRVVNACIFTVNSDVVCMFVFVCAALAHGASETHSIWWHYFNKSRDHTFYVAITSSCS